MSKGSKRRKPLVDSETVSDNWDRIDKADVFNDIGEKDNEKNSKKINLQS